MTEAVTTKSELSRHQGFSPAQHVLGKQPRAPGSLLHETESLGALLSRYDETSPYYLRHRARQEAKKAFIHLDISRKVAKALQRNAAPLDTDYKVGDLVIYRRDKVPGSTATVWSTVSRVIGNRGADAHKDLANTPGSSNYTIDVGDYRGGGLWAENAEGTTPARVQNIVMQGV